MMWNKQAMGWFAVEKMPISTFYSDKDCPDLALLLSRSLLVEPEVRAWSSSSDLLKKFE